MTAAANFFNKEEKNQILEAIKEAELNTSGEIRLHIENRCNEEALDRAAFMFSRLEMHKTKLRNGVLFYLAIEDRKFAILGDAAINAKVPSDFWDASTQKIINLFKEGKYAEGLASGIIMAGQQLKTHFPYEIDDINELSDDISFGNN